MRRCAALALAVVAACAPAPPIAPGVEPALTTFPPMPTVDPATVRPPPPAPEPIPPPKPRRACQLERALDDFLAGQEAAHCGVLKVRPSDEDYERVRACVVAAHRAGKPFSAVWGVPGTDSVLRQALGARIDGGRYDLRWFAYDGCRSGCGDGDPTWTSEHCETLVDVRAYCKGIAREQGFVGGEVPWICTEEGTREDRELLELGCIEVSPSVTCKAVRY